MSRSLRGIVVRFPVASSKPTLPPGPQQECVSHCQSTHSDPRPRQAGEARESLIVSNRFSKSVGVIICWIALGGHNAAHLCERSGPKVDVKHDCHSHRKSERRSCRGMVAPTRRSYLHHNDRPFVPISRQAVGQTVARAIRRWHQRTDPRRSSAAAFGGNPHAT